TVSKQTEIGLYTDRKRSPQKTKDNNSKNNIPKDNTRQTKSAALDLSNLPAWLSVASMEEFIRHRREIRKPLTPLALSKLIGKLETFRAQGHDVQSILDESIANGWQGVFEPKGPRQTANVVDWNDTSWGDDLGEW
ncbi:hypothetical protein, partial [Hahella sp. HN01]|uniref:hypothetical protein n=1 Tax=Hahella sp. HN01 TaxID=2847262 RepID=UPI001C1EE10B